jgi:dTDP-glucose pyrophosphorylase
MTVDVRTLLLDSQRPIRDAVEVIDRGGIGLALVAGADGRLVGTLTDGDLRRGMLAHIDFAQPVQALLDRQKSEPFPTPLTLPAGATHQEMLHLMNEHGLRHIPLVDAAGQVVEVALLNDLAREYEPPMRAVVMAGGYGSRLRPLTDETPKPMLPVGDRPLLEHIVGQLRDAGIRHVNIATHHLAAAVSEHFGDGRAFGVEIEYVHEEQPLGTAGSLSRLAAEDEPILVVNGDILTRVDFRALHDFHRQHAADMTIAVRLAETAVAYGVVETDGVDVTKITEKPVLRHFVNAGIYLLTGEAAARVPHAQRYDMPELIRALIAEGRRVVSFPLREYWRDIGEPTEYEQALTDMRSGL